MSSKDAPLYGVPKPRKMAGTKELSTSTNLSFSSQLSSLITNSTSKSKPSSSTRLKPKKENLFHSAAKQTSKPSSKKNRDGTSQSRGTFEQKHTTSSEGLDAQIWERSRRRMEEKARLYAAMKRGDIEDVEERYAVDFDRKWAEGVEAGGEGSEVDSDDEDPDAESQAQMEYLDEFGRTRTGTRADAARAQRTLQGQQDFEGDRFTARPVAPQKVIYGDTIQHAAFEPSGIVAAQMEALAAKRDRSLTPPPDEHFDARQEIREKGTGFFQFSADSEERRRQMEGLEAERVETERRRAEREDREEGVEGREDGVEGREDGVEGRKDGVEGRKEEVGNRKGGIGSGGGQGKRKADDFLDALADEWHNRPSKGAGATVVDSIERAVEAEEDAEKT